MSAPVIGTSRGWPISGDRSGFNMAFLHRLRSKRGTSTLTFTCTIFCKHPKKESKNIFRTILVLIALYDIEPDTKLHRTLTAHNIKQKTGSSFHFTRERALVFLAFFVSVL